VNMGICSEAGDAAAGTRDVIQHSEVYRERGQFAGWPANYGLWIWGDEVVVVFVQGLLGNEGKIHARDRHAPFRPVRHAASIGAGLGPLKFFPAGFPAASRCRQTSMSLMLFVSETTLFRVAICCSWTRPSISSIPRQSSWRREREFGAMPSVGSTSVVIVPALGRALTG
jgi:hypothetical protein